MANPLKCDLCSKPATVHLTQILDNKVHKVDLCEACAQEKGVTDPSGFSLADLLLKTSLNPDPAAGGMRCEQCGFSPAIGSYPLDAVQQQRTGERVAGARRHVAGDLEPHHR